MGYIRHKRDHLPLYIHNNPVGRLPNFPHHKTVFKGRHDDLKDKQTVETDKKKFEESENLKLFLTIDNNQICYRTKEEIVELLEGGKNKGAIKRSTRIRGKNTNTDYGPMTYKSAGNTANQKSKKDQKEPESALIQTQQQTKTQNKAGKNAVSDIACLTQNDEELEENESHAMKNETKKGGKSSKIHNADAQKQSQKQEQKNGKEVKYNEPKQEPDEKESELEKMLREAKAEENRKLKEQIARLEREKQELIQMQKTKEEEMRRFERTQKKNKKNQLQA